MCCQRRPRVPHVGRRQPRFLRLRPVTACQAQAGPSSWKRGAVSVPPSRKAVPGTLCPRLPSLRAVTRGHSGIFRPHGFLTAIAREMGTVAPIWRSRSGVGSWPVTFDPLGGILSFPVLLLKRPQPLPTLSKHSPPAQAWAGGPAVRGRPRCHPAVHVRLLQLSTGWSGRRISHLKS